ncbi:MAG: hypothetical protein WKF94_19535 [Solirubrobacteraceae bacterium]
MPAALAHMKGKTARISNERFKGGKVTGSIKVEGPCSAGGTYTAKK